ncbi:MAG: serine/threonine-protein kinase [Acidobacteriota bacterium]
MADLPPIVWFGLLVLVGLGWWLVRRARQREADPAAERARPTLPSRPAPAPANDAAPYVDAPQNNPQRSGQLASTLPLQLQDVKAAESAGADRAGLERIHRALNADQDELDRTWATLKHLVPAPGQQRMALQTMDRLAKDFEAIGRFDAARDVYEHMADLDPAWPDVKVKLSYVREQALAAATLTRPVPTPGPASGVLGLQKIGRYPLRGEIGRGAMGAVYLAHDPETGAKVALKTMALSQEFEGDGLADARARFQREAEMAGRLVHPDIVHILDSGEDKGLAYIAMEYVDGTDMGFFTRPGHLLPVRQLLSIIARVAEALAYAHTQGVTHRDVKPANIMVDLEKGVVKVMDFGVARVADAARTRTGVVLGTPTYMSPEQLSGQPVDGRSDIYSLGVTLFQLLTGQLPYQHTSMATLMRAISKDTPPPVSSIRPELPPALDDIVGLALQKHPNTRYSTGHQMAEDLRSI